jgi:hypothetical protein
MRPFLASKVAAAISAATEPLSTDLAAVRQQVDPDASTVNERLAQLRGARPGQNTPPPAAGWRMSNNASATRLDVLEPLVQQIQAALSVLTATLGAQFAGVAAKLELAQATASQSIANDVANALAAQAADAKAVAAQTRADAANTKADLLKTKADEQAAATTLLQAHATADEATLASLQTALTTAQQAVTTAQGKADAAAALAAQARSDAADAKAAAADAKSTAVAAQASVTTLAARFRAKLVATPAVTLTVGTPQTQRVTWDTAFPDANYEIELTAAGTNLTGVRASYTDKTAAGFTLVLLNAGALSLTLTTGAIDAFAYRP